MYSQCIGILTADPQDTITNTRQPPRALGVISAHGVSPGEISGKLLNARAAADTFAISYQTEFPT